MVGSNPSNISPCPGQEEGFTFRFRFQFQFQFQCGGENNGKTSDISDIPDVPLLDMYIVIFVINGGRASS